MRHCRWDGVFVAGNQSDIDRRIGRNLQPHRSVDHPQQAPRPICDPMIAAQPSWHAVRFAR